MLYLWIPELKTGAWRWCISSGTPVIWQTASDWATLVSQVQSLGSELTTKKTKQVTLFFPSGMAQIIRQPMLQKQFKQLGEQGLKYAIEEFSITPVEQLVCKYQFDAQVYVNPIQQVIDGEKVALKKESALTVLALPKTEIHAYQQLMNLANWQMVGLYPDFLLLPVLDKAIAVYDDDTQWLIRVDQSLGYRVDQLDNILPFLPQGETIHLIPQPHTQLQMGDFFERQCQDLGFKTIVNQAFSLKEQFEPSRLTLPSAYNFSENNSTTRIPKYWLGLFLAFLVALLIQMAVDLTQWYQSKKMIQQVHAQSAQLYSQWFVGEKAPATGSLLKRAFKKHLKDTDSENNQTGLILLSKVGMILSQNNIVASQVDYRGSELHVSLKVSSLQQLDDIKSQINAQGMSVDTGSATGSNSALDAVITVKLNS